MSTDRKECFYIWRRLARKPAENIKWERFCFEKTSVLREIMAVAGDTRRASCLPPSLPVLRFCCLPTPQPLSAEYSGKEGLSSQPQLHLWQLSLPRGLPTGQGTASLPFHFQTVDVAGFLSEESWKQSAHRRGSHVSNPCWTTPDSGMFDFYV